MRQDRRFQKKKSLTKEQKRLIPLAGVVVVLVLLILIVFIVGQKNKTSDTQATAIEPNAAETISAPEQESDPAESEYSDSPEAQEPDDVKPDDEPSESETIPDTEPETEAPAPQLQKNSIPEILSVMEQYFTARANADADTINALYGVSGASEEALVAHRDQLLTAAKYISSFDDVTTYIMEGTAENNWLVYTTTDIRFFAATAKAPMIMWCFIEKGYDDSYHILDNHLLSQDMLVCADTANHSEEVRALASEVNSRLRTALEEDADLDEVYGILRAGSPLWKDEEETEAEVVILDDSETAADHSSDGELEYSDENTQTDTGEDVSVENGSQTETVSDTNTDRETETDTDIETDTDANAEADTDENSSAESDARTEATTDSSGDTDTTADESPAETQ